MGRIFTIIYWVLNLNITFKVGIHERRTHLLHLDWLLFSYRRVGLCLSPYSRDIRRIWLVYANVWVLAYVWVYDIIWVLANVWVLAYVWVYHIVCGCTSILWFIREYCYSTFWTTHNLTMETKTRPWAGFEYDRIVTIELVRY